MIAAFSLMSGSELQQFGVLPVIQRQSTRVSTGFSLTTQLQPSSNSIGRKPKKIGRRGDHRLHNSADPCRFHQSHLEMVFFSAFVQGALRTANENCPACYADGFHFLFFEFLSHFPKALVPTLSLREPEQRRCQENSRLQRSRSVLQPAGHRVCQD